MELFLTTLNFNWNELKNNQPNAILSDIFRDGITYQRGETLEDYKYRILPICFKYLLILKTF